MSDIKLFSTTGTSHYGAKDLDFRINSCSDLLRTKGLILMAMTVRSGYFGEYANY